ncbi:MAG: polyribonucleotide nucleotidyltransferase [Candidatus Harrisonbacteria bacterium]|nr:polyribonucleotide nucleotidyltransferase [Candidatus Harrisonbacteria bacterium]
MDLKRKQFKTEYQGRPLVLEVSDLAKQANAAVLGRYGDTAVLVTAVMGKKDRDTDFFPLVVDYEERFYAAGKILGSRFVRREGRPSEEAILSGRMIDRTVRPLFDHRMRREVQVAVTILEMDEENDPDFITMLTASTALAISNIPWNGPVAGARLFHDGKKLTINPLASATKASWPANKGFTGFVAGTSGRINMIELEGVDADEKEIAESFAVAQKEITHLVDWQNKIVKEIGRQKSEITFTEPDRELINMVKTFLKGRLEKSVYVGSKSERMSGIGELKNELMAHLAEKGVEGKKLSAADNLFENEINELVHEKIISEEKRPDNRKLDEVRDLLCETGLFKRTHGSALFVRGDTQALVVTTIAPPGSEQLIETMEFSGKRRFMLHYNFPPFSTGETGRMGAPGRREIGHGALAEKAVRNLIPPQEEFPYTIRVVSEIMSSNGSSSMASVCGASMSLMDAGVPIKKPVAGIAMGLMTRSTSSGQAEYKVLTDIQGPEDHHGDADFKIAGTEDGVRAIQMDVKIDGLTDEMIKDELAQGRKARLEILKAMNKTITHSRKETSPYAPAVLVYKIDPSRIGELIGPGGKTINSLIARTGATIDVEQTGEVYVAGTPREKAETALKEIEAMFKEYNIGDIVEGEVVKILDFGAIVEFGPNRDGMIHVSELKEGFVKKVEDVVKVGDFVRAKIIKVENGKIGLTLKGFKG